MKEGMTDSKTVTRMKVVITHTDFRIYWPARLNVLSPFLQEKGIDLEVVEISGAGSHYDFAGSGLADCKWNCLFPGTRMEDLHPVKAGRALRKKLDELDPDIVIAGAIAYPSGASAVKWAVKNKKRCIIFDNARISDVPRSRLTDAIKREIYSSVDAILCPSDQWNETFRYFGFTDDQLFYGLNVVDNTFWKVNGSPAGLQLPFSYFLTVGRQIPEKNFRFLVLAYNEYVRSVPDPIHLVLVGDGPERELISSLVNELALNDLVHLYPFKSQEELKDFYRGASWFVLPSLKETWGLVVNEAMASGLPVMVSRNVGCYSTLVEEGLNGFGFSPYLEVKLAGLMKAAASLNDEIRTTMGKNSYETISSWDLDRFCSGVLGSVTYATQRERRVPSFPGRLLISLWEGRYRPV
jgi:glycosyltransferase involved in cell wall biosynthesis